MEELNRHDVPLLRCDIGQFPTELTVSAELGGSAWSGDLDLDARRISLADLRGIYYRRPTAFRFPDGMSSEERWWSAVQARLGFGGLLSALDPWLNHPHSISYAEYKPVQLRAACRSGLTVPRTLLTNDPDAARRFVDSVDRAVCMPFGANTFIETGRARQLFSTSVTTTEITDSVRHTMHLFQEWAPKSHEIRLTVVDDEMFAARIDAGSADAHQDWRSDYHHLSYCAVPVPDEVSAPVTLLMQALDLRFGALDFVVDHDGHWRFLECNPNGQWGWIQDEVGLPIAAALASALEGPR